MCGMDTGAGLSFPERPGINNFISELILFNNLLYNLYSFKWESIYLKKSSSSKTACMKQKIIFSCIWHIKQLFSYPMNIINSEHSISLLA